MNAHDLGGARAPFPFIRILLRHQAAAVAALCAAFFVAALVLLPRAPEIQPDSVGYMQFAADRTAGYPAFLALIGWADPQLSTLPVVQLLIFCGSLLFFAAGINRATHCLFCSIAAVVLIFGNYELVKYCSRVMTEALFVSLLMAALGSLAFWLATARLRWIALASGLIGAAVAVRPAGYALFVMFPVLYLAAWNGERRRLQLLAAMIAPAALVLFLNLAAYHQRHQTWNAPSVLGYNLLGKAISFADGMEPSSRPELIAAAAKMAALYRERFKAGENWADRVFLSASVYDDVRRNLPVAFGGELGSGAAADRATTRLALDIIAAHKIAYLRNVAENFAGLWYLPELMTANDVERRSRDIVALKPPMSTAIEYALVPRPWALVISLRLFQMLVLAASVAFLIALPVQLIRRRQADRLLWFGFAASSALHAGLLIVAAINEAKPRLMLDSWPLMILAVVLALNWIVAEKWPSRRPASRRDAP